MSYRGKFTSFHCSNRGSPLPVTAEFNKDRHALDHIPKAVFAVYGRRSRDQVTSMLQPRRPPRSFHLSSIVAPNSPEFYWHI